MTGRRFLTSPLSRASQVRSIAPRIGNPYCLANRANRLRSAICEALGDSGNASVSRDACQRQWHQRANVHRLGAVGAGEVPSLALGPGLPAGTTGERRHSGREAGIQAMEGTVPSTSTPAVSFIGVGNEATGLTTPQGY